MKEEKQDKPKAPRGPQPTVEEREIRAVLVAVIRDSQNPATAMEYLDELEFLAETADIKTVKRFTQRLPQPMSAPSLPTVWRMICSPPLPSPAAALS